MIPLGVLASAYVAPAGGTSDLTWLGSAFLADNSTSYTFTSQPFGVADPDRHIIVGAFARNSTAAFDVTIGGVTATAHRASTRNDATGYAIANVPTGTTGSVVMSFSGSMGRCLIGLWSVPSAPVVDELDYATLAGGATLSVDVTSVAGGHVLALCAATDGDAGSWTFSSNITTRATINQAAAEATTAAIGDAPSSGALTTVTADWSVAGATSEALTVLSFHL